MVVDSDKKDTTIEGYKYPSIDVLVWVLVSLFTLIFVLNPLIQIWIK
jgi:hypothetical protein